MKLGWIIHLLISAQRASSASLGSWLLQAAFMALNNLIFFSIWLVLFRSTSQIGGMSFDQMLLLLGISAVGFGLVHCFFGGYRMIPQLINDGSINSLLLRPRSPLFILLSSKVYPDSWGDICSGVLLIYLSQLVTLSKIPLLVLALLLSMLIFLSISLVLYSLAFWLANSERISDIFWENLLSFSIYPEGIFPKFIRPIIYTVFPTAFIAIVPVKLMLTNSWGWAGCMVGVAAVWGWVAWWVFNAGVRRFVRG